jgi:hypothetical protein
MPKKILLGVGCDKYQYLPRLNGAEKDAEQIISELTKTPLSLIEGSDSILLLSPTRNEFQAALGALQDRHQEIESLTVFFAGHGGVANGSYYLCLSDTRANRMATTGLALSHIFEFINELKAAHCNLIIDTCQAGGMVSDISALLKPDVIGGAKSCGVSIFVSSAADQSASETHAGGWGTTAILQVLRGEIDTGSRSPQLDLLDIGRAAAKRVADTTSGQQLPSVWGMNLYGTMPIYGNPHATGQTTPSLLRLTGISPASAAGELISSSSSELLGLMFLPPSDLTPEKLYSVLFQSTEHLNKIPGASAAFVEGVWSALEGHIRNQTNTFAVAELTATCISLLLQAAPQDDQAKSSIMRLASALSSEVLDATSALLVELDAEYRALCLGGISDFFYLPQRIARVLGWSSAAIFICTQCGLAIDQLEKNLDRIATITLDKYAAVVAGMSEAEAPFWMVFLYIAAQRGRSEHCEQVLGTIFNAFIENGGALARSDLEGGEVLEYLLARAEKNIPEMLRLSGSPSELLSISILFSEQLSLQEIFDYEMHLLDHVHLNIFIPNDHSEFSLPVIANGRNHVFQIGHGVWRGADLASRWQAACVPQLLADSSMEVVEIKIGALCSSLVFPDRVPWFLLLNLGLSHLDSRSLADT